MLIAQLLIVLRALCLTFLLSTDHACARYLQKTLLKSLSSLTKRMANERDSAGSFDPLALIEALCQCLDVAGSPNYYDLPILESSLECLLHLTARYVKRVV